MRVRRSVEFSCFFFFPLRKYLLVTFFDLDQAFEVRALVRRACAGPLPAPQQQTLLQALEKDPRLAFQAGVTPAAMAPLVEHNPLIAVDLLLRLLPSSQKDALLDALARTDMSLHSMEVVNRLTTVCICGVR